MLIERSLDPRYLSNAYVVGDEPGGSAVFVDSGAPLAPLLAFVEEHELTPRYLLRTHSHLDHVANESELDLPILAAALDDGPMHVGRLEIDAIATPGHCSDMVCFVVSAEDGETVVFSGDTLFKDSVGGGDFDGIRDAVMRLYMAMPHSWTLLPGHTDASTIGREWEQNPFIAVWRDVQPEGSERVLVHGTEATLIVWRPDYDGKGKAWVRYDDGSDAIVGGSAIERHRHAHGGNAA